MTRDMTKREFDEALKRHGFSPDGFMGYCSFTLPSGNQCGISRFNGGTRRRDQLAYLIQEKERMIVREKSKLATAS